MTVPAAAAAAAQVAENLTRIRARIAAAARTAGRSPDTVRLIAVSKVQPAERVAAALAAGHRLFGENRVQEAERRWPPFLARYPDIRLHLIGPLQTNKVKAAVRLFDAIETVDRARLARALAAEMDRTGKRPDLYIQVNTGAEPQKAGVVPGEADGLIRLCRAELGLPIVGLMGIPPQDENPALHFALLADIAARHGLPELSMGMSGDYETAVRYGATTVRVGTAIFGNRQKPTT